METIQPQVHELVKVSFSVPARQVSVVYRTNISSNNLEDELFVCNNRLFEKRDPKAQSYKMF